MYVSHNGLICQCPFFNKQLIISLSQHRQPISIFYIMLCDLIIEQTSLKSSFHAFYSRLECFSRSLMVTDLFRIDIYVHVYVWIT